MRPSHVFEALVALLRSRRSTFLWGPPGVCKSSLVHQLGAQVELPVLDYRLLYRQPVDLLGVPGIQEGRTVFHPPADFPMEGEGIFFLDELAQSEKSTVQVAAQIALERRCGDNKLGDGWVVIAASNRQEDRAGAHRLPSNLLSRFIHLDVDVSVEDWQEWALQHEIQVPVRSWINFKPGRLHCFDASLNQRAFPSPRSWHALSDVLPLTPPALRLDVFAGIVGPGDAAEFLAFLEVHQSLPDREQLLADPDRAAIPQESSIVYALCGALAEMLRPAKGKTAPVDAYVRYVTRFPKEYCALALRDGCALNRGLLSHKLVEQWCRANHYLLAG